MKIIRHTPQNGNAFYLAHLDDGTKDAAYKFSVVIDGFDLRGICAGADEEEGWADVLVQDDGTPDGYVGPPLSPLTKWLVRDRKVVTRRLFGKVTITRRQAA